MISKLVKDYRTQHDLTLDEMADQISLALGVPNAVTKMALSHWEHGRYRPNPLLITLLSKNAPGELGSLATKILAELEPAISA